MKAIKNAQDQPDLLESPDFQIKYGFLFENLNFKPSEQTSSISIYWNGLYLIRWTVTVCILIFLKDKNQFQLILLLVLSVMFQTFVLAWKPFSDADKNRMTFIYEFANSLYLYLLLCLTDFQGENKLRDAQGLGLLIVISTVVLINLIRTILAFLKWIKQKIMRLYEKQLSRWSKKYLESKGKDDVANKTVIFNSKGPFIKNKFVADIEQPSNRSQNHQDKNSSIINLINDDEEIKQHIQEQFSIQQGKKQLLQIAIDSNKNDDSQNNNTLHQAFNNKVPSHIDDQKFQEDFIIEENQQLEIEKTDKLTQEKQSYQQMNNEIAQQMEHILSILQGPQINESTKENKQEDEMNVDRLDYQYIDAKYKE